MTIVDLAQFGVAEPVAANGRANLRGIHLYQNVGLMPR
jgi:hypothetical protein